ncbi:MAG: hypothetical protein EBU29_06870 [Gammaproteobacteria bacterium]|nr:hypothetical protein [Gammaproteobacteria bacterium]
MVKHLQRSAGNESKGLKQEDLSKGFAKFSFAPALWVRALKRFGLHALPLCSALFLREAAR